MVIRLDNCFKYSAFYFYKINVRIVYSPIYSDTKKKYLKFCNENELKTFHKNKNSCY